MLQYITGEEMRILQCARWSVNHRECCCGELNLNSVTLTKIVPLQYKVLIDRGNSLCSFYTFVNLKPSSGKICKL